MGKEIEFIFEFRNAKSPRSALETTAVGNSYN